MLFQKFRAGRLLTLAAVAVLATAVFASSAYALPLENGDFSSGLSPWQATGATSVNAFQEAVVAESFAAAGGSLGQLFDLPTVDFFLDFDFDAALFDDSNSQGGPFAFPDYLAATLYLSNNSSFTPAGFGAGDDYLALLDLDGSGFSLFGGDVTNSSAKPGWSHFQLGVDLSALGASYQFGYLSFELFDLNLQTGDSEFFVDNVQISEVPEPATLLLMLSGGAFAALRSRRSSL